MKYNLPNIDNIRVSSNEIVNSHTINRLFSKLLENDIKLDQMLDVMYSENSNVREWNSEVTYDKGDFVWFQEQSSTTDEINIYLLKSLINDNRNRPQRNYSNDMKSFEESGWEDKNPIATITYNDLEGYVRKLLNVSCLQKHQSMDEYHKYGRLSENKTENDVKLMSNNLTTANPERDTNFFPYVTYRLKQDDTVLDGYCRKWDNGLLEYDVVYRLGYTGSETYDQIKYDSIYANNVEITQTSSEQGDLDYTNNDKYFNSNEDMDIFNTVEPEDHFVIINSMYQRNKNDYVNTYSGNINFIEPFYDLNYMIFCSDVKQQVFDTSKPIIGSGNNHITFVNKSRQSITPLYITYSDKNVLNGKLNGLLQNTFHCQIIGTWKQCHMYDSTQDGDNNKQTSQENSSGTVVYPVETSEDEKESYGYEASNTTTIDLIDIDSSHITKISDSHGQYLEGFIMPSDGIVTINIDLPRKYRTKSGQVVDVFCMYKYEDQQASNVCRMVLNHNTKYTGMVNSVEYQYISTENKNEFTRDVLLGNYSDNGNVHYINVNKRIPVKSGDVIFFMTYDAVGWGLKKSDLKNIRSISEDFNRNCIFKLETDGNESNDVFMSDGNTYEIQNTTVTKRQYFDFSGKNYININDIQSKSIGKKETNILTYIDYTDSSGTHFNKFEIALLPPWIMNDNIQSTYVSNRKKAVSEFNIGSVVSSNETNVVDHNGNPTSQTYISYCRYYKDDGTATQWKQYASMSSSDETYNPIVCIGNGKYYARIPRKSTTYIPNHSNGYIYNIDVTTSIISRLDYPHPNEYGYEPSRSDARYVMATSEHLLQIGQLIDGSLDHVSITLKLYDTEQQNSGKTTLKSDKYEIFLYRDMKQAPSQEYTTETISIVLPNGNKSLVYGAIRSHNYASQTWNSWNPYTKDNGMTWLANDTIVTYNDKTYFKIPYGSIYYMN